MISKGINTRKAVKRKQSSIVNLQARNFLSESRSFGFLQLSTKFLLPHTVFGSRKSRIFSRQFHRADNTLDNFNVSNSRSYKRFRFDSECRHFNFAGIYGVPCSRPKWKKTLALLQRRKRTHQSSCSAVFRSTGLVPVHF